jgi:exodeoxyribonuclease VII large subunit
MAMRLPYMPRNGDAVEVHGSISVYEAAGQYQLYTDEIRPAGEGLLYQEFIQLKGRLEAEGLFEQERKRAIPQLPARIGVVTSPTGAALRDILNTIKRRFPMTEVILAPTIVQGEDAPARIISAIEGLNRKIKPDVILVARGGGSIEDLWAFNNENVARAIFTSQSPIITGIGHETDFTIADFVSDLRASTPTAAAELATPNRHDLKTELREMNAIMLNALSAELMDQRLRVNQLEHSLLLLSPTTRLRTDRQRIDELFHRIENWTASNLQLKRAQLHGMTLNMASLNPMSALQRGYSSVTLADGTPVHSIHQVEPTDILDVRVVDGTIAAQVKGTREIDE